MILSNPRALTIAPISNIILIGIIMRRIIVKFYDRETELALLSPWKIPK